METAVKSDCQKGFIQNQESRIQPRRWPAGLDYENHKKNRINALDRIGGALQSARSIDPETSKT